ncbi:unnamed protein product, partial [Rotaria sordida]
MKDDIEFKSTEVNAVDLENTKEAARLKELGNAAFNENKMSEAIQYFTKAIVISNLPSRDLAILYSNRSAAHLGLYEQRKNEKRIFFGKETNDERYQSLLDAKQSRNRWPTWPKAHFRIGKSYSSLNEHEKAINSFERALAFAPSDRAIKDALDDSRTILQRQLRQQHLDPLENPTTMNDFYQQMSKRTGMSVEQARLVTQLILENHDSAEAHVLRGHQYFCGDTGVQQNYELAARWYTKAAQQGNAEGLYHLALVTDQGLGVSKDRRLAVDLLEQAASKSPNHSLHQNKPNPGVAEAEHTLGMFYYDGVVVTKNVQTAAYWFR